MTTPSVSPDIEGLVERLNNLGATVAQLMHATAIAGARDTGLLMDSAASQVWGEVASNLLETLVPEFASALRAQADRVRELEAERDARPDICEWIAVTVGGGLSVYGTAEAVHRVQNWIMLDSTHPVEKEDVRRSLMRDLTAAESTISSLSGEVERLRKALAEEHLIAILDKALEARNVPAYGHNKGDWVRLSHKEIAAAIALSTQKGEHPDEKR